MLSSHMWVVAALSGQIPFTVENLLLLMASEMQGTLNHLKPIEFEMILNWAQVLQGLVSFWFPFQSECSLWRLVKSAYWRIPRAATSAGPAPGFMSSVLSSVKSSVHPCGLGFCINRHPWEKSSPDAAQPSVFPSVPQLEAL